LLRSIEQLARGHRINEISRYEGSIHFARQSSTRFNGDIACEVPLELEADL
jgi:hypothetical protein